MTSRDRGKLAPALTPDEQHRVDTLLASVSTNTLLRSLARLDMENADAQLIIAALLDRFPDR